MKTFNKTSLAILTTLALSNIALASPTLIKPKTEAIQAEATTQTNEETKQENTSPQIVVASDVNDIPNGIATKEEPKKEEKKISTIDKNRPASADLYKSNYFSTNDSVLTTQDQKALKIVADFKKKTQDSNPIVGKAGEIRFVYGAQSIEIVCAVMQVCDIALEEGEQINAVHLGDTARWSMDPAITGFGGFERQHIIIKPYDIGLQTNLFIATNRRSYHIDLKSHKTKLMPEVSFIYPEESLIKFQNMRHAVQSNIQRNTIPETKEYLGNLNFNYKVESDEKVSWSPLRVYNDGRKTIIQMPKDVDHHEIPSLMIKDPATDNDILVNYRYQDGKYIVDQVFQQAVLIIGVGDQQQKVTIKYLGKE